MRRPPDPFETWDAFVAYRVFKQTRRDSDGVAYEVVDRFAPRVDGTNIVARFTDAESADAMRDSLRAKRLKEVTR